MKLKLFIFFISFISLAFAQDVKQGILNKLLAPGPLIEGHKNLEKVDCLSCHDAGKGVPNSKCLDCHKELNASIQKQKSFHANIIKGKACIDCHGDHKGREFDTTLVDEKKFNHTLTGHVLHGKHQEIKCIDCHKETRNKMATRQSGTRFFGLVTSCKSCHQKQDVHFFKNDFAKKDCNECHNEIKWNNVKSFDHSKVSSFKLEGKHAEMSCAKCHTPNGDKVQPAIYKWDNLKQDDCLTCHKPFHQNTLSNKYAGGQCSKCHEQNSWKIPKFNHAVTGVTLNGKHAEINCIKCHVQKNNPAEVQYKTLQGPIKALANHWMGLQNNCNSCHKDIHSFGTYQSNRFGRLDNCKTCHNERSFKEGLNFNHSLDTRFKIDGKHKELTCIKCHTPNSTEENSTRKYFFKDLEKDNCVVCHKSPHLKTFSEKNNQKRCSSCHVTASWKETKKSENFNHNFDTNFKLDGKHTSLTCAECHKEGDQKIFKFNLPEKQYCESCHSNVHTNQFSSQFSNKSCLECHNTDNFKDMKKFDHNKTTFKLDGKHADPGLSCSTCHKPTNENLIYKGKVVRPKGKFQFEDDQKGRCTVCHTNVHVGQFSKKFTENSCMGCHTTETFHKRLNFNHATTSFATKGFHEKLDCIKCHVNTNEQFATKEKRVKHKFIFSNLPKDNCKTCHKDVHKGEFGNSCTDCHSDSKKWKLSSNFHQNFLLNGVHFTLKCNECHKDQRRLGGMGETCQLCHQKDDIHKGSLPNCKECHKQEFWEVTTFKHSLTSFPLKGAHRVLSCNECHSSGVYQGKSSDCMSCHLQDKINRAPQSGIYNHSVAGFENCSSCHNQFIFK